MSGQIIAAPVKWKPSPTTTERRPSAIAVLQINEPIAGGHVSLTEVRRDFRRTKRFHLAHCQQCARSVIRVRHCPREIAPSKATRVSSCERMPAQMLTLQQPLKATVICVIPYIVVCQR